MNALVQLRDDARLPEYVAEQLGRTSLSPTWRDALLLILERIEIPDSGQREELARVLRDQARAMAAAPVQNPALWAALRRLATLTSIERAGDFLEFLDSGQSTTRQATLQSLHRMFFGCPPPLNGLEHLIARLDELAEKYFDRDFVTSPDNAALALSLFEAITAMGGENVLSSAKRIVATDKSSVIGQARQVLADVLTNWGNAHSGSEQATRLRRAIEVLDAARCQHM